MFNQLVRRPTASLARPLASQNRVLRARSSSDPSGNFNVDIANQRGNKLVPNTSNFIYGRLTAQRAVSGTARVFAVPVSGFQSSFRVTFAETVETSLSVRILCYYTRTSSTSSQSGTSFTTRQLVNCVRTSVTAASQATPPVRSSYPRLGTCTAPLLLVPLLQALITSASSSRVLRYAPLLLR